MTKTAVKNLITWSPNHLITSRKSAFTLAEVLITLAIIGVVASMTIPTLVAKYEEKQTISQVFRVYSTLSNAYQMMLAEYGPLNTWGLIDTDQGIDPDTGERIFDWSAQKLIAERLKKYLRVSKTCEINKICYDKISYTLSGEKLADVVIPEDGDDSPAEARFFLNNGTYLGLGYFHDNEEIDFNVILPGKNSTLGKNRFYFVANSKGVIPEGKVVGNSFDYCDPTRTHKLAGRGCAAWIIQNKNMDYLHCREKLGWDKAKSCKE
ncbi:MAG: type II secretion system protein [Cyanobacteria bacterium SIG32]|nr:type II secretion system protein [Cyanobacteria bacterium SIG32]